MPEKKPGGVQDWLTLQWCVVSGRKPGVGGRVLKKHAYCCTQDKPYCCDVWCLGKSLAVKFTYDRLWCVVSGKKPGGTPWYVCIYIYRHRIEKRVQIRWMSIKLTMCKITEFQLKVENLTKLKNFSASVLQFKVSIKIIHTKYQFASTVIYFSLNN